MTRSPLPDRTIRRHLRDMRRLLERIDRYAAPADSTEQRHLTQAIHGMSRAAQALSLRYHGRPVTDHPHDADDYDAAQVVGEIFAACTCDGETECRSCREMRT